MTLFNLYNNNTHNLLCNVVKALFVMRSWTYKAKNHNMPEGQCILALWHAHQCGLYSFDKREQTYVMISRSKDGDIIAGATERVGIKTVRGSKSKGGAKASLELINKLKEGNCGAITVDGPRGPKRIVKKGIVEIAKITGVPIVTMSYYCKSKGFLKFNSWDEFRFPLFGAPLVTYYSDPIYVPQDANDETIESIRKQIEDKLNENYEHIKSNYKELKKSKN